MGWRLFRRVRLAPGMRLNFSRSGPSISIGPRGLTRTFGRRGTRTTASIPGTGISFTEIEPRADHVSPVCEACGGRFPQYARFCPMCGAAR